MDPVIPTVHVIAVAFQKFGQLKVFVQSWLNQNRDNWILTVIHDGPNAEFDAIMAAFAEQAPDRVLYYCTETRFNDYGHTLRDRGLKDIKGDYVMLSNADNYFIPRAIEFINDVFNTHQPDVVLFDMIHSHNRPGGRDLPAYSYFKTSYQGGSIDVSSAIVRAELANKVGFRDKTHNGDETYFNDIGRLLAPKPVSVVKISRVLFVHN